MPPVRRNATLVSFSKGSPPGPGSDQQSDDQWTAGKEQPARKKQQYRGLKMLNTIMNTSPQVRSAGTIFNFIFRLFIYGCNVAAACAAKLYKETGNMPTSKTAAARTHPRMTWRAGMRRAGASDSPV